MRRRAGATAQLALMGGMLALRGADGSAGQTINGWPPRTACCTGRGRALGCRRPRRGGVSRVRTAAPGKDLRDRDDGGRRCGRGRQTLADGASDEQVASRRHGLRPPSRGREQRTATPRRDDGRSRAPFALGVPSASPASLSGWGTLAECPVLLPSSSGRHGAPQNFRRSPRRPTLPSDPSGL